MTSVASTDSLIGVVYASISTAKQLSVPTKVLEDMKELYLKAIEQGYGSKDASSVVEVLLGND